MSDRVAYRTCPLCEATCGLTITTRGPDVISVRGDADDVTSGGFICPKGVALGDLHHDPDRLTTPLVRREVNSNLLTDELPVDPLSGTAVLNGIPVTVTCVR